MAFRNLGSPRVRLLSGAGAAGPRRLAMMGGTAVVMLGIVGILVMRGERAPTPSHVTALPAVNVLPGGMHSNPYYNDLATQQARQQAQQAASAGQSSVAPIPAGEPARPVAVAPPVAPPTPRAIARPAPPAHLDVAEAYAPPAMVEPAPLPPAPGGKDDGKVYAAAVGAMLAHWGGGPAPSTQVYIDPDKLAPPGPDGDSAAEPRAVNETEAREAGYTRRGRWRRPAAPDAPPPVVLIPAGRGVYAVTKLAADSDTGGPVVVTAESGPIAGDDMTGTFSRRGDRLVVTLNSISLPDGEQESIDGLLIAPDSMETAVASSVDQHVMSRFVLPVAAAFVAGLGQAIEQSNSTVAVSPFGGFTAQNHLNLNQQLGVAAGSAGAQLQNFLLQDRPNGPTVKLAAGVNVGVIFLKPVTAGAMQ